MITYEQFLSSHLFKQLVCMALCLPSIFLLKYLTFIFPKKDTFAHKMLVGTGEIVCIAVLSVGMVLNAYVFIPSSSIAPVVIGIVCTMLVGIIVLCQNLMGERKRRLTEMEKAELMDM